MGRTVMPFSYVLEKEHGRWTEFRKGLGKKDQQTFDRFFDRAKFRTAAAVYMAPPWPLQTILLSICLEHEKMLGDILGKVKERDATRCASRFVTQHARNHFVKQEGFLLIRREVMRQGGPQVPSGSPFPFTRRLELAGKPGFFHEPK